MEDMEETSPDEYRYFPIVGRKTCPRHHWASADQCIPPSDSSGNRDHNTCFRQVQNDMSKTHSVNKEWQFVSKGRRSR